MAEENENAQAESMFQSWDGKPIYAKKAELDKNGNSLELTIEGDTVVGPVYAGRSMEGVAEDNILNMYGGTVQDSHLYSLFFPKGRTR